MEIKKVVKEFGRGAHVYLPKAWIGQEVVCSVGQAGTPAIDIVKVEKRVKEIEEYLSKVGNF